MIHLFPSFYSLGVQCGSQWAETKESAGPSLLLLEDLGRMSLPFPVPEPTEIP